MLPKPFLTLFTVYKREYLLKAKTGDYPVLFERFFFVSNALCLKTTTGKDCWCCSGSSNVHALYRKLSAMRSWASLLEKGPWTNRMVWGRFEAFCAFICSFPFQVSIFSATATKKTFYAQMLTSALEKPFLTSACHPSLAPLLLEEAWWKTQQVTSVPITSTHLQSASASMPCHWGPCSALEAVHLRGVWCCPYIHAPYCVFAQPLLPNNSEN